VKPEDYNYSVWNPGSESFEDFATKAPQVTSRAPSFPVEDLATGEAVQLKDIWRKGVTIVEFGSFT
jgi:hypothetical protein